MTTYSRKQQAIISKGIASNIVKMNLPDFDEVNKLFGEFDIELNSKGQLIDLHSELETLRSKPDKGYTTKEVIEILGLLFVYSGANGGQLLSNIFGQNNGDKIRTILFEYNTRDRNLPVASVLSKLSKL